MASSAAVMPRGMPPVLVNCRSLPLVSLVQPAMVIAAETVTMTKGVPWFMFGAGRMARV